MLYQIQREYGYICYVLAVGDDELGVGDDELGVGDDEDASSEAAEGEAQAHVELGDHVDEVLLLLLFTQHGCSARVSGQGDSCRPHVLKSFVILILMVIFEFYSLKQIQWYIYVYIKYKILRK